MVKIVSNLASLDVVMRAKMTEIIDSGMADTHEKTMIQVLETVMNTFEDVLQPTYSVFSEGLKS